MVYERVFGHIVGGLGAYFTMVNYITGGIEYEILVENDDFILMEELNSYDDDD